jgi:hypothetical protein
MDIVEWKTVISSREGPDRWVNKQRERVAYDSGHKQIAPSLSFKRVMAVYEEKEMPAHQPETRPQTVSSTASTP